jgi:hypothetical protein
LATVLFFRPPKNQAIIFCQSQGEEELWESLISHCLSRPDLVAPLLNDIGAHVDPVKVLIPVWNPIDFVSQNILIKWFWKVNFPTKSSTYC